jgi:hypothetical protein
VRKYAMFLGFVITVCAINTTVWAILSHIQHTPEGLPHRLKFELYSIQGEYSQPNCPGQHVESLEVDGRLFFLGCYGDTTGDANAGPQ